MRGAMGRYFERGSSESCMKYQGMNLRSSRIKISASLISLQKCPVLIVAPYHIRC